MPPIPVQLSTGLLYCNRYSLNICLENSIFDSSIPVFVFCVKRYYLFANIVVFLLSVQAREGHTNFSNGRTSPNTNGFSCPRWKHMDVFYLRSVKTVRFRIEFYSYRYCLNTVNLLFLETNQLTSDTILKLLASCSFHLEIMQEIIGNVSLRL